MGTIVHLLLFRGAWQPNAQPVFLAERVAGGASAAERGAATLLSGSQFLR